VTSRWRIRHKLLLGLGLVVALMALLVLGTLRGLWSYYVLMNNIRGRQAELKTAEQFRTDVFDLLRLTKPETASDEKPTESAAPPKEPIDPFFRFISELRAKADTAKKALDMYDLQLKDTAAHGLDPISCEHQDLLVQKLVGNFEALEQAEKLTDSTHVGPNATKTVMEILDEDRRTKREQAKGEPTILGTIEELETNANQLRNNIYDVQDANINESRDHYQTTLWIVVPASIVGLLVMTGLMLSFYAWVFHPIRDLQVGVGRVAHGDFSKTIELHSGDEMEELATAFNDMMTRLRDLYENLAQQVNDRSRQLVRSERLASVGFLAAGVAHEINNPLASIAFCSEALESRLAGLLRHLRAAGRDDDAAEVFLRYLRMIQEEAFRCKKITERLLDFSQTGERRREPTDLGDLVRSVLEVTQHLQNAKGKVIAFEPAGGRVVAAVNPEEIKSVVLNLVVNAAESMDEGGRLTIRLKQIGDAGELQFADTGCGMSQDVLDNIFEPFFTRSRTGKGTGLGLTISHSIVNQHGGDIAAASDGPGRGSTFTVRLPLRAQTPAREPAPRLAA
jgi:signal transduction histidine kinase